MGRRRVNRRQTLSRANSEMTLMEGDASSDAESTTSVTVRDNIRDSPILSDAAQVEQNSILPTRNRFSPMEENSTAVSEARLNSNPPQNRLIFPPPNNRVPAAEFTIQNSGYGDEHESESGSQAMQANLTLQTFLKQANQQNESNTRVINECMTGTANMIRDTCESMKECMTGIATMTQSNFHQLLHEVRGINDRPTRSQPSNQPSILQQSDTSLYQQSQLGISRPVITSCLSPEHSEVTSLAPLQTSTLFTQSRIPSSSQVGNHSSTFPSASYTANIPTVSSGSS